MFVDLTAAYDSVLHRGLTCKLLRLLVLPAHDSHGHGDGWQSQLRPYHRQQQTEQVTTPKNGVTQGSVLAPLLFNIYISDLPTTTSRKHAYADDLAIMHGDGDWQEKIWRQKVNTSRAGSLS